MSVPPQFDSAQAFLQNGVSLHSTVPAAVDEKCPICHVSYKPENAINDVEPIAEIKTCHHYFHTECLHTWLTTSHDNRASPNTCPLCRAVLYHRRQPAAPDSTSPGGQTRLARLEQAMTGLEEGGNWGPPRTTELRIWMAIWMSYLLGSIRYLRDHWMEPGDAVNMGRLASLYSRVAALGRLWGVTPVDTSARMGGLSDLDSGSAR